MLSVITNLSAQCNNLLVNGDASAGLTGWNFSTGTGTTWVTQNSAYGPAFVASYNWTTKYQVIDLYALGYTSQYLDQEPLVSFSQMFHGHATNYADKYYYKIELKNASNQLMDSYNYGTQSSPITTTSNWDTVAGNFSAYGTGLRYIRVECGGDDAEFWAGNYGTIIDNSVVSIAEVLNVGICSGSYSFNNQTLTSTGTYTGNFEGTYGCDSIVVLNLHVGPYNIDDTFNLCQGDTFFYDSQAYTSDTTLSGAFTSSFGCDSNISYEVNFIPLFDDTIWAGICPGEFYVFGGQSIFTPGTYIDVFTSQYGCDSNVVLELSANPAQYENHTDYMCDSTTYDFGGIPLTSPGTYFNVFTNTSGCDSIVNLTLLQSYSHNLEVAHTLCPDDTFYFGTQVITESGTYQETFFTQNGGCDSLVILDVTARELNLQVQVTPTQLKSLESEPGTNYQWLNCNEGFNPIVGANSNVFTPSYGGSYAVRISKSGLCIDTSNCKDFIPLGIADFQHNGLSVFPNPAEDEIIVEANVGQRFESVELRDMLGRIIWAQPNDQLNRIAIDLSALESGSYLLVVASNGQSFQEIVVKK